MTFNFLSKSSPITAEAFDGNRKYFYLIFLIMGACFTDSPGGKEQLMVAVPLMLVFEWSVILMGRFRK